MNIILRCVSVLLTNNIPPYTILTFNDYNIYFMNYINAAYVCESVEIILKYKVNFLNKLFVYIKCEYLLNLMSHIFILVT